MTPQDRADRVIQIAEKWEPQFGKGVLIRLLRANVVWEIEQAVKEAQHAGRDWSSFGVSTEGASWAMEASK